MRRYHKSQCRRPVLSSLFATPSLPTYYQTKAVSYFKRKQSIQQYEVPMPMSNFKGKSQTRSFPGLAHHIVSLRVSPPSTVERHGFSSASCSCQRVCVT